jgi:hypothetical protein
MLLILIFRFLAEIAQLNYLYDNNHRDKDSFISVNK